MTPADGSDGTPTGIGTAKRDLKTHVAASDVAVLSRCEGTKEPHPEATMKLYAAIDLHSNNSY
jgi:hypothetical protein